MIFSGGISRRGGFRPFSVGEKMEKIVFSDGDSIRVLQEGEEGTYASQYIADYRERMHRMVKSKEWKHSGMGRDVPRGYHVRRRHGFGNARGRVHKFRARRGRG